MESKKNSIVQIGTIGSMSCFLNSSINNSIKRYCEIEELKLADFCYSISYIEFDDNFEAYYLENAIQIDEETKSSLIESLIEEEEIRKLDIERRVTSSKKINDLFYKAKQLYSDISITEDNWEGYSYFLSKGNKSLKIGVEDQMISYLEGLLEALNN